MNDSKDGILKALLTLLGSLLAALKDLLMAGFSYLSKQDPERELNKPPGSKTARSRQRKIIYFALALILTLFLFNSVQEVQSTEIPFSQFINLVKEGKIDKAVVTERYITGLIRPDDAEKPAQNFMTIPLWQTDLAEMLAANKVDFVVRSSESWLSNLFFNWIIPMLILVLIWSWVMRRTTAGGAQSFLNLGDKIHIHQDTQAKITFDDVAGADSAKQELKESIDFLKTPEKFQRLGGRMPKGVLLLWLFMTVYQLLIT